MTTSDIQPKRADPSRAKGGFHLYLLVFPFVYQFYSIIEALVSSSFANDEFRRISVSFHHHFKIHLLWLLDEKECSFYSYLFCCTEMTWMFIISTTIWVNGWDTSSVASRARSELTSSQCNWKGNWKGKGTDETPLCIQCIVGYFLNPLPFLSVAWWLPKGIKLKVAMWKKNH